MCGFIMFAFQRFVDSAAFLFFFVEFWGPRNYSRGLWHGKYPLNTLGHSCCWIMCGLAIFVFRVLWCFWMFLGFPALPSMSCLVLCLAIGDWRLVWGHVCVCVCVQEIIPGVFDMANTHWILFEHLWAGLANVAWIATTTHVGSAEGRPTRVQTNKSRVQICGGGLKPKLQNPKSKPSKSKIQNPNFKNPDSEIEAPKAKNQSPKSTPKSKNPNSKLQNKKRLVGGMM